MQVPVSIYLTRKAGSARAQNTWNKHLLSYLPVYYFFKFFNFPHIYYYCDYYHYYYYYLAIYALLGIVYQF